MAADPRAVAASASSGNCSGRARNPSQNDQRPVICMAEGCRALPIWSVDHDRVAGGDLPVDLRVDRPEPGPTSNARSWPTVQWWTVQEEERQDQQLLRLSNQILELTKAIHALDTARSPTSQDGT